MTHFESTLLDTDILSLFMKGNVTVAANVSAYLQQYGALNFSIIIYYEIISGLKHHDARRQLGDFEVLAENSVVLPVTTDSANASANAYAALRKQGKPVDDVDLLIAGVAIANGLHLATHDMKHFERIEGLTLQDWSRPL